MILEKHCSIVNGLSKDLLAVNHLVVNVCKWYHFVQYVASDPPVSATVPRPRPILPWSTACLSTAGRQPLTDMHQMWTCQQSWRKVLWLVWSEGKTHSSWTCQISPISFIINTGPCVEGSCLLSASKSKWLDSSFCLPSRIKWLSVLDTVCRSHPWVFISCIKHLINISIIEHAVCLEWRR